MAEKIKWNKKIFAMLLNEAKGVRSWRQFASDADVSYVQMRKLALGTQENPPRPKLIRKIAQNAFGEIDLSDLMYAAGMHVSGSETLSRSGEGFDAKYLSLSLKDRKTVDKFMDFLASEAKKSK
ncbi:MAG: hypothetical protein KBS44_05585 [Clostridiales bacterium]|nr:hypothetical protein [Candidatus Coliplasma equi]